MTRTDMAHYLNLSAESVSRALTQLQKRRVIALPSNRAVIVYLRKPLIA